MSLESPTIIERITAWPYFRIALPIAGLVVLLGVVLFAFDRCSTWNANRGTEGKRANVNAAIEDLKQANVNIVAAQKELANAQANVAVAADDYLEATNVTDGTRNAVNAAIERQKLAANTNRNVNAAELEELLKSL